MIYPSSRIRKLTFLVTGLLVNLGFSPTVYAYTSYLYGECERGNGIEKTIERKVVSKISIIELSGPFRVNIASSKIDQKIRITGDENLLPLIKTQPNGNQLTIFPERPICGEAVVTLDISLAELIALSSSGSDDIHVTGINTQRFSLVSTGSGNIELSGDTFVLDANISGSGDLESRGLRSRGTKIRVSGSSNVFVNASQQLSVDIIGIADVYYTGDPLNVSQEINGSGSLTKIE